MVYAGYVLVALVVGARSAHLALGLARLHVGRGGVPLPGGAGHRADAHREPALGASPAGERLHVERPGDGADRALRLLLDSDQRRTAADRHHADRGVHDQRRLAGGLGARLRRLRHPHFRLHRHRLVRARRHAGDFAGARHLHPVCAAAEHGQGPGPQSQGAHGRDRRQRRAFRIGQARARPRHGRERGQDTLLRRRQPRPAPAPARAFDQRNHPGHPGPALARLTAEGSEPRHRQRAAAEQRPAGRAARHLPPRRPHHRGEDGAARHRRRASRIPRRICGAGRAAGPLPQGRGAGRAALGTDGR